MMWAGQAGCGGACLHMHAPAGPPVIIVCALLFRMPRARIGQMDRAALVGRKACD
jgi:hypothetical protein